MKKLYTLGIALSMVAFGTQSFAQVNEKTEGPELIKTQEISLTTKTTKNSLAKGGSETVYWQEDFSNGFDGQDGNGAWTVSEDLGSLWFVAFPADATDGYDPTAAILDGVSADYGTNLPNYGTNTDVVNSPTRDNGVMMMDADRWNSTGTVESPPNPDDLGATTTDNPITSALVSPTIDLSGLGITDAVLTFYTRGRCFSTTTLTTDLSIDGGDTWIPYDVYAYVNGSSNVQYGTTQISFNISEVLAGAADLTNIKLRFFWGGQTHYYWTIDDIAITSLPGNDLVAGKTWTNNYYESAGTVFTVDNPTPATEYYDAIEYYSQPEYYTRPYNFAMAVTNVGSDTQTGVTLNVTATSPVSETTYTWPFEAVELESGVTDTLKIENAMLTDIGPLEVGQYIFDFSVSQDQDDISPANNMGDSRQSTISNEIDNNGFAIMRNDANSYTGAYTTLGQDVIWNTPYVFPELTPDTAAKYITHVEAVFLNSLDFAETIAGELVYFNVRQNHPFEEDETIPETASTVFFGSDNLTYDDQELEFTIQESDIWYSTNGLPFVWASFQLPTPILIEPGVVYLAEFRVPAAGGGIVFPPVTADSEEFSSALYDFADGDWFSLGLNAMPIRFRTATSIVDGLDDVSYESGLTLIQNYPNPMTDMTKIQFSVEESTTATLEVRDITGKLVFTKGLGTLSANVPQTYELQRGSLAPGVYTYSLVTPEFQVSRKLTVQ